MSTGQMKGPRIWIQNDFARSRVEQGRAGRNGVEWVKGFHVDRHFPHFQLSCCGQHSWGGELLYDPAGSHGERMVHRHRQLAPNNFSFTKNLAAWRLAGAGSFKSWHHFYRQIVWSLLFAGYVTAIAHLSMQNHTCTNRIVEWLEGPKHVLLRVLSSLTWFQVLPQSLHTLHRWISVQASAAEFFQCSRRKRSLAAIYTKASRGA